MFGVARGQRGAEAVALLAQARQHRSALARVAPGDEPGAHALERAGGAVVEDIGLAFEFAQHAGRSARDALSVCGGEFEQRIHVARSPLRARGRSARGLVGPLVPAERGRLVAALARVGGKLQHGVVGAVRAQQFGFEQAVGVGQQAGLGQRMRRARHDGLALGVAGHFALGTRAVASHVLLQHRAERRAFGQAKPRECHACDQRVHALALREPRVGREAVERGGPDAREPLALAAAGSGELAGQFAHVVQDDVGVLARQGIVGQQAEQFFGERGVAVRRALARAKSPGNLGRRCWFCRAAAPACRGGGLLRAGDTRLQQQAQAGLGLLVRAGQCKPLQSGSQLPLGHELLLVAVPGVIGQQAPVGRAELGRLVLRQRQRLLDRPRAVKPERQQLQVFLRIDFARQARNLAAVRAQQQGGRVAAHLEPCAKLLRAGLVAIEVDRHEAAALVDEVGAVEDRGLDLVARRAPGSTPVQKHRLAELARFGEHGVHLGFAARLAPGDGGAGDGAGRNSGRCLGRHRGGQHGTGRRFQCADSRAGGGGGRGLGRLAACAQADQCGQDPEAGPGREKSPCVD